MRWRSQQDSQKNPLSINPFWERASAEPPLEWSKWPAIVEMAVFAKDGIEIRNLLGDKPELVDPPEPILEVEITVERDAQRKNREVRNQEKREGWENRCLKACENGVLCNSVEWDEADAKVRSCLFLSTEGQRQVQQLDIQPTMTKSPLRLLEDIFVTKSYRIRTRQFYLS